MRGLMTTETTLTETEVSFADAVATVRREIMRENDYSESEVDRVVMKMSTERREDMPRQLVVTVEYANIWGKPNGAMRYGVSEGGVMWEERLISGKWENVTRYFRGED